MKQPGNLLSLAWQYSFIRKNFAVKFLWYAGMVSLYLPFLLVIGIPFWLLSSCTLLAIVMHSYQQKNEYDQIKDHYQFKELKQDNEKAHGIYQLIKVLSTAANIPLPKIITTEDQNTFVESRQKYFDWTHWGKGIVLISHTTVQKPIEELIGPLAHEIAHLRVKSSLMISLNEIIGLVVMLTLLFNVILQCSILALSMGMMGCLLLTPIHKLFCKSLIRNDEYFADEYAAILLQNVEPVYKGLLPLQYQTHSLASLKQLLIHSPMTLTQETFNPGKFYQFYLDHPLPQNRIRHLCEEVHEEILSKKTSNLASF